MVGFLFGVGSVFVGSIILHYATQPIIKRIDKKAKQYLRSEYDVVRDLIHAEGNGNHELIEKYENELAEIQTKKHGK